MSKIKFNNRKNNPSPNTSPNTSKISLKTSLKTSSNTSKTSLKTSPKTSLNTSPEISTEDTNVLFVGIDIAKRKHCARAVNSKNRLASRPFFFSNRREGFERLLSMISKWLGRFDCSTVVIGMEPTAGYWEPMYCYLENLGFELRLVSPLKVKRSKDLQQFQNNITFDVG